jgi:6-phosphogluconolactonase
MPYEATLMVAPSKSDVPSRLNPLIADCCIQAIQQRGIFTIALSGGSLPSFLSSIKEAFKEDPKFDAWHVILADERCVPNTHEDSNLNALQKELFSQIPVPASQIYSFNQDKLKESTEAVAQDYESTVRSVLSKSGGQLDLAVLGFGPDGHTCSLFPGHALLQEKTRWVAPIDDSPKPPPSRITLTYPVLNTKTRNVIFCGAGGSKSDILKGIFASIKKVDGTTYTVTMKEPAPYPCAGVLPNSDGGTNNKLTWVVDADAMEGVIESSES